MDENIRAPDEQITECLLPMQQTPTPRRRRRRRKKREHHLEYDDEELLLNREDEIFANEQEQIFANEQEQILAHEQLQQNQDEELKNALKESLKSFEKEQEEKEKQQYLAELKKKYGILLSIFRKCNSLSIEKEFYDWMMNYFENGNCNIVPEIFHSWLNLPLNKKLKKMIEEDFTYDSSSVSSSSKCI